MQMYSHASRLPVWRLRTGGGKLVHLLEGCFLPPAGAPLPPSSNSHHTHRSKAPQQLSSGSTSSSTVEPADPQQITQRSASQIAERSASPTPGLLASQGTGSPLGIGPAALTFMCKQLPLLDVPWTVKLSLEAAGVS